MSLFFSLSTLLMMNFCFLFLFHPVSMIFTLVIQTLLVAMILFSLLHFSWFSYSLILIFLGGMLVIFMYMSNVASDEIFKPNSKILLGVPIIFVSWIASDSLPFFKIIHQFIYNKEMLLISKPFYFSILPIIMITASVIIIAMLAVVKITKMKMGPLRVN